MSRLLPRVALLGALGLGLCVAAPRLPAQSPAPAPPPRAGEEPPPFWARPDARAREDLGSMTRAASRGVMLVGFRDAGHGTAWVLSRRHRLLVTNAHVADILGTKGQMVAIVNGTEESHRVERVWYHPGVRREAPGGKISIRSECPADGEIFAASPDVAVLQLAANGPPLTVELPMATPEETQDLFARPVGMLGFPGFDTRFPDPGAKAQGTYHDGVISRLTNFRYHPDAPEDELQFVHHTAENYPGFSGSPLYLANGHVVAINNCMQGYAIKGTSNRVLVSRGIRVDCLWELLVHHGLDAKVPVPIDKTRLRIGRWLEMDEDEKRFRQAVKLVDEAATLIDVRQEYLAGVEKCTEAIKLAPDYPDAYRVRCAGRNGYYCNDQPSKTKARDALKAAVEDAEQYAKMMSADPRWLSAEVNTVNNLAGLVRDVSLLKPNLGRLDKALNFEGLPRSQRAEFASLRGTCRFNLGDRAGAMEDFNNSIRLDPQNDILFDNRARFWQALRRYDLAESDRARARSLRGKSLETPKAPH